MGPLVERNILEVEEELDQVKEDQDGEFVMPDNQFDNASSLAGDLRKHLKRYIIRVKSNKCNQCHYASFQAADLRTHLKTHSGEKLNKCNQCNYASSRASDLRRHLKTHSGEKSHATNVSMPLLRKVI